MSLAALKAALRREEEVRLSEETQAAYAAAEAKEDTDWLEVTEGLQERVLQEVCAVPPERMAAALYLLRAASQLFAEDDELRQISLYVRHNRAEQGCLRPSEALTDVPLHSPSAVAAASTTSLRAACAGPHPTLLVAGSFT